jgi:hypothetical protein
MLSDITGCRGGNSGGGCRSTRRTGAAELRRSSSALPGRRWATGTPRNVSGLVKGGSKSAKKSRRPHRSRGAFVFCCPHGVISGFHFFLRGESPQDAFAVLYTRKDWEDLPKYVVYDNACQLRNYCMRREPAFFSDVTFVVDR